MKKYLHLIIGVAIIVVIALGAIWARFQPKTSTSLGSTVNTGQTSTTTAQTSSQTSSTTNNQTAATDTANLSDNVESFSTKDVGTAVASLNKRIASQPWSKLLPLIADHYTIYYQDINGAPGAEIALNSQTAAERSAWQKEAIQWLKDQGAPVDKLPLNIH